MLEKKGVRSKTLLAVGLIGGSLYGTLPAVCNDKVTPTSPLLQQIATEVQSTPETRAYCLLRLADGYLSNPNEASVESQYKDLARNQIRGWEWTKTHSLVGWLQGVSKGEAVKTISFQNMNLAAEAIRQALEQLKHTSDKYIQLNLYFAASQLLKKMGNLNESRKCGMILTKAFQSCQGSGKSGLDEVRGAASVCDWMAYKIIPVESPDDNNLGRLPTYLKPFTEEAFLKAEKLKLKAVGFTDQLDRTAHVRRKAHRDLFLWYIALGKTDKAEREKQIVFELVGINDDRILFPQSGTCGQLDWWRLPTKAAMRFCGMG